MSKVKIDVVSSLNIRSGREDGKLLKEPIEYECSCGKHYLLGADSFVLAKIQFSYGGKKTEVILCDTCLDVFVDAVRFGPRAIQSGKYWELCSRAARISIVQDELFCFKCLDKDTTHLFMKFDDITKECVTYSSMRVCAKCTVSYLTLLFEREQEVEHEKKITRGVMNG